VDRLIGVQGSWQHFLPATYLAGFSETVRTRRRESLLWVGRRGGGVYRQKAEGVGAARNLYTLRDRTLMTSEPWHPDIVDTLWQSVENRLVSSIDQLLSGTQAFIDAEMWAKVLVNFVAQLFVRGPDFEGRYRRRLRVKWGDQALNRLPPVDNDRINGARLIELMRLRGTLIASDWTVLHAPRGSRFMANDLGRITFQSGTGQFGYLIPLRADGALFVTSSIRSPTVCATNSGRWLVGPIHHSSVDARSVRHYNFGMAHLAWSECYGATEVNVHEVHAKMGDHQPDLQWTEPRFLALGGVTPRSYEGFYDQFLQYIAAPPVPSTGSFRPKVVVSAPGTGRIHQIQDEDAGTFGIFLWRPSFASD
jgi:hypothetical protein